jgi:hypothetical protein
MGRCACTKSELTASARASAWDHAGRLNSVTRGPSSLLRSACVCRVLAKSLTGVCAALLLTATPGCLLVGYSPDDGSLAIEDAAQRRVPPPDAGVAARVDGGGMVVPADAGAVADAGAEVTTSPEGCGLDETCLPSCSSGHCQVSCANSSWCWTTCESNTVCTIDCSNGGICDMDCHAGASCEVDCRDTRDCDYLKCEAGASCVLHCGNNLLGCSLYCAGVAMTCANNVHVCDAPCPVLAAQ